MNKNVQNINIKLNPDGVVNPIIQIMKECTENIMFGLKTCDSVSSLPEELKEVDTFFQMKIGPDSDFVTQKNNYKDWLYKKGFEELTEGIKLSLVEAYFYVAIIEFVHKQKDVITLSDLQDTINYIRKKASKQSLPGLLEKINKHLTSPLNWENQIISINNARNCLVHRKGIVTGLDINDKENNNLLIEWVRFKIYYEHNEKEIELHKNQIVQGPAGIKLKSEIKQKRFSIKEKLHFDYKEFNEFVMCCLHFALDLKEKLPKIDKLPPIAPKTNSL